eukprot:gnl/MRDRNA2_/MRDRNA2_43456_c0_seq1.p1 gnl/MRDRNA2_/MRDRNA2_43456_c0~~gnl/MRDRNA2_/MRDRNA2_43456_c0_seq1.p1  ORF type:complete len:260 (-),score=33.85 gnl/MRDRNA2_/MRDRNA2_43456_c0_seq1:106-831(-)
MPLRADAVDFVMPSERPDGEGSMTMALLADAVEFVMPPSSHDGEELRGVEGMGIEEIEARLLDGWLQAFAEGRILAPNDLQSVEVSQPSVLWKRPPQDRLHQACETWHEGKSWSGPSNVESGASCTGGSGLFCPWCIIGNECSACPFHFGRLSVSPRAALEPVCLSPTCWSTSAVTPRLSFDDIKELYDPEDSTDVSESCYLDDDACSVSGGSNDKLQFDSAKTTGYLEDSGHQELAWRGC